MICISFFIKLIRKPKIIRHHLSTIESNLLIIPKIRGHSVLTLSNKKAKKIRKIRGQYTWLIKDTVPGTPRRSGDRILNYIGWVSGQAILLILFYNKCKNISYKILYWCFWPQKRDYSFFDDGKSKKTLYSQSDMAYHALMP